MCFWCSLRVAFTLLFGSVPTCGVCLLGRQERVHAYLQRLRRAAEGKAA